MTRLMKTEPSVGERNTATSPRSGSSPPATVIEVNGIRRPYAALPTNTRSRMSRVGSIDPLGIT